MIGQCFHVDMNSLFNVNETYTVGGIQYIYDI